MENLACLQSVVENLVSSHSPFHVVANLEKDLLLRGYLALKEGNEWNLEEGKGYFVKRNDSSIIAFRLPKESAGLCFHIAASHSDSPSFKIKPNPLTLSGGFALLQTEPYGGGIYHTWMDRPLSFAGRILYSDQSGIHSKLVDIDQDLLVIPSVCIHFERDVNEGKKFNPAVDMVPVFGSAEEGLDFDAFLKAKAGLSDEQTLLSHDLFLYVREKPHFVGWNSQYLLSPREDDLSSAYSSFYGFLHSENNSTIPMFCCFDNEEVGSLTRQGARSTFLKDVVARICGFYKVDKEEICPRSFLLSIDNGHAKHPNHPELSSAGSDIRLNKGIMVKFNANQSYTSDGLSSALIRYLARKERLNLQDFTNRSDLRGGSTLGNLSNGEISFLSADIGLPQLAMHSCNELLGALDVEDMGDLCRSFYSTDFSIEEGDVRFKN